MVLWFLWACGLGSLGEEDDTGGDPGLNPEQRPEPEAGDSVPAVRAEGDVAWTLAFDADAEAVGFSDCTYTRTWTGLEALDQPYLCPECTAIVWGEAEITEGLDCYLQLIPTGEALTWEGWGFAEDGRFFRSGGENRPAGELSAFVPPEQAGDPVAIGWEAEYEMTDGGNLVLSATGTYRWWMDADTLLDDPMGPRENTSSSCGWPRDNPGTLTGVMPLALGEVMPNVRLEDQCGEPADLWDFHGRWLILDSSQEDCGPCRTMADESDVFIEAMAAEGIEVVMLSMMGNGLDHPWGTPPTSVIDNWVSQFNLGGPVLKDRGYAYSLFPNFLGPESFGFPAWLVVNPQMQLVNGKVGYNSWDEARDMILGTMD
jgi:hypothetical protein